jgi:nucleoside-diphosphate-sugar epimerase
MAAGRGVFLTGATGFLGRYLLRDLLASGRPVTVLVRDKRRTHAEERIAELVAFGSQALGRRLPRPLILTGELGTLGVDLPIADRRWLAREKPAVLHAAANLSFHPEWDGEPERTNVGGTEELLRLSQALGLTEWHHVSTAFVCGRRRGTIYEADLECGQAFHNAYEQSKFDAERSLRRARGLRLTVYRPSVIVGDSRTGYTCTYAGIYRFLELAARLADAYTPLSRGGGSVAHRHPLPRRPFPLRLPVRGEALCNLVPVDWVSRAILAVMDRPRRQGRTFHLTARSPLTANRLHAVAAEELGLEGSHLTGPEHIKDPSRLEELFHEGIQEYRPYLGGRPVFDFTNTAAALPDLPAPPVGGPLLRRLIRFAVTDHWGRAAPRREPPHRLAEGLDCATYLEQTFPRQARRSRLARTARLNLLVALDIHGPGGGQWSFQWTEGELAFVRRGLLDAADVAYHTDTATFQAVLQGRQSLQQAFFERHITIAGDLETALKLATLLAAFLRENPRSSRQRKEASDALRC